MKISIRIQPDKVKFVKNKGMHLLNNFVPINEAVEIDLAPNEEFILESVEFKHWFEKCSQVSTTEELSVSDSGPAVEFKHWFEKCSQVSTTEELSVSDSGPAVENNGPALAEMGILDLRKWCKEQGFKNYTQLNKADLLESIEKGTLQSR